MQEINVAFGGSLRRDLHEHPGLVRHHADEGANLEQQFGTKHRVTLETGGLLGGLLKTSEIEVNSVHHQGMGELGRGLKVEARAPDGLVEAISAEDAPIFAVQWHPEWRAGDTPHTAELFRMFGACLRGASLEEAVHLAAHLQSA
jgi:putative glutamine amidotransferase